MTKEVPWTAEDIAISRSGIGSNTELRAHFRTIKADRADAKIMSEAQQHPEQDGFSEYSNAIPTTVRFR